MQLELHFPRITTRKYVACYRVIPAPPAEWRGCIGEYVTVAYTTGYPGCPAGLVVVGYPPLHLSLDDPALAELAAALAALTTLKPARGKWFSDAEMVEVERLNGIARAAAERALPSVLAALVARVAELHEAMHALDGDASGWTGESFLGNAL